MRDPESTTRRDRSSAPHLFGAACLAVASLSTLSADLPDVVEVARSPDRPWSKQPTRTLSQLPTIPLDADGSPFGGYSKASEQGTGFFRTTQRDGRWWLVDPEGHLFLHRGVTSVRQIRSTPARESLLAQFGSDKNWASATCELLRDQGFNGLGAWCDEEKLQPSSSNMVYTQLWNFMSSYGKKRGGTYQKSGHTGYPNGCPFIFDPEFPEFCDKHASQLATSKDDPWLLGHFTDNELPWNLDLLENYLDLPERDPGHRAAIAWLKERHGPKARAADITDSDRTDFLAYAADTYFSIVSKAIRKHDPNHLILGSRFHGRALRIPELFEAAGRHVDVISVNYYHAWTPDPKLLATWAKRSGRPIVISEWYAKALDSNLANTSGAGWLVRTQADRAAFYQNFTLGLLESKVCVGWHWFRYSDNDPEEKGTDPSNRDANKGMVSNRYVPYDTLLDGMKDINERTFGIIRHFDYED
ncbi:hypothetical protein [Haloferula rosea]|uniref:Agarase n=1 Tax=Haloferula rosea TaxID=490093 RepID=A0A934VAW2_9BACT|nr:hypothetical protein [Haloferula rosea]MBK1826743.1 hypothetical protein [Haloferula rosea]